MYAPRGGGGASLLYISVAYYMQMGGGVEGVQRACINAYVINGRPHIITIYSRGFLESINFLRDVTECMSS